MSKLLFSLIILASLVSGRNTAPTIATPTAIPERPSAPRTIALPSEPWSSAPSEPHAPSEPPAPICDSIMADGGLTPDFSNSVAHRLHSLTLEDLRHYFNPDATEDNNIPTVNLDLDSDVRVLPNAPLYGYDTSFVSQGLRHLDQVLRKMDTDNSITNFSTLEKVAHTLHMAELWTRAKVHYDALTLMPPSSELCSCVSDTHNNGVLQQLHLLALKIKYPGITSGEYQLGNEKLGAAPPGYNVGYYISYTKRFRSVHSSIFHRALTDFDFDGNEDEDDVVARVAKELVDGDNGTDVHLDNESDWEFWKEDLKTMEEYGNYEFAVFMFCVVNS